MDIIRRLNWVDILTIILMVRISYVAFLKGLSHEIFPIMTGIASLVICLYYYNRIGGYISQNLLPGALEISNFLSFLLLAIGTGLIFKLLRSILDKVIKVEWHPFIERIGGAAFGIARGAIVVCLVLEAIALAPLPYFQWSIRDKSLLGMHFVRIGPALYEKASKFLPMMKTEGQPVDKEAITKNLVSNKTIRPAERKDASRR